jgi:hypothetical protein
MLCIYFQAVFRERERIITVKGEEAKSTEKQMAVTHLITPYT